MNCSKLYALVRALEGLGLSHDEAFERAFVQYKKIKQGVKA